MARKITDDLKRNLTEEKPLMTSLREAKWFEKFYWFISSEGYLILGYILNSSLGVMRVVLEIHSNQIF